MNVQGFSIDLTDPSLCGVYFVTAADIDTLATAAHADDLNVHRIDLAGCRDKPALMQSLANGLSLPPSFGHDWDALADYLRDMGWMPSRGHILLLTHGDDLREANEPEFDAMLDVLEESAAIWADEGVAFFAFLALPDSAFDEADAA